MIHIDSITLENFQTHKKTTVALSPFFNVIIGSSRSGKSSFVRATDFLLYNNWYEDYVRFGADHTTITAKLSNGKTIVREKGPKTNKIAILGEKEERFESFGFTLPSEVSKTMGIIPIEIEAKDPVCVNISNQDDPLFLLYETGTDRTKVLSRLSGLHWIDFALKDLSKDRRTKSAEVEFLKESNASLRQKLKSFTSIDSLRVNLNVEKARLTSLKKVTSLIQSSKNLLVRTTNWKREFQLVQNLKGVDFKATIAKLNHLILVEKHLKELQDVERRLRTNKASLDTTTSTLQAVSLAKCNVQEELAKTPLCPTCNQVVKEPIHSPHGVS